MSLLSMEPDLGLQRRLGCILLPTVPTGMMKDEL